MCRFSVVSRGWARLLGVSFWGLRFRDITVQKNLASLPRVMTAPSALGPSVRSMSLKARMISWAKAVEMRFSGALCRVMTKTWPWRSTERSLYDIARMV